MVTPDDEPNKPSEKRKTTADALSTSHQACRLLADSGGRHLVFLSPVKIRRWRARR
jgi:hypothetical protein